MAWLVQVIIVGDLAGTVQMVAVMVCAVRIHRLHDHVLGKLLRGDRQEILHQLHRHEVLPLLIADLD